MTAIANTDASYRSKALRPFNFNKDLDRVADLIELCFAPNLDPDGKRYIRKMRETARQISSHPWPLIASLRASLPISGYVWEEGNELIGNLSLIPLRTFGKRIYLIANVAVHPDYRRQGIARALTQAALHKIKRLHGNQIWLQVRTDNQAAIQLYNSMGFDEICRRTTWDLQPQHYQISKLAAQDQGKFRVRRYQKQDWNQQKVWLMDNYPENVRWQIHIKESELKPGLIPSIRRLLDDIRIYHSSVTNEDQLAGVVTWQRSPGHTDHLWVAADPLYEPQVIKLALDEMIKHRKLRRKVVVDHPEGRSSSALEEIGFKNRFTLIWMQQTIDY